MSFRSGMPERSAQSGSLQFYSVVGLVTATLLMSGCGSMKEYALTPSDEYVRDSDILEFNVKPSANAEFGIDVEICNISDEVEVVATPSALVNLFLVVPDTLAEMSIVWSPVLHPPEPLPAGDCLLETFDLLDPGHDRTFEGPDGRYECRLIYHSNVFTEDNELKGLILITMESEPFYLVIRKNELVRVEWE